MKLRNKTLVILALLGLLTGAVLAAGLDLFKHSHNEQQKAKAVLLNRGIINILLIGLDARPGETNSRSDTMILASIDTGNQKAALLSVPRDTRIQNGDHYIKINAFNVEGGPELAREKVEELLGVPIHYYVVTNFSGFKDIVDAIGGVNLEVETRMYKPSEGINLKPGLQHLNGYQALAYCRYRDDALGDIGRTERQQKFIQTLITQVMQPANITRLPKLVPVINQYVTSDIPLSKLYLIAQTAREFKSASLNAQTLPGWFYTDPVNGASYWAVDTAELDGIVTRILGGETIAVIDEDHPVLVAERSDKSGTNEIVTHPADLPELPENNNNQPSVTVNVKSEANTEESQINSTDSTSQSQSNPVNPPAEEETDISLPVSPPFVSEQKAENPIDNEGPPVSAGIPADNGSPDDPVSKLADTQP